MMDWLKPVPYQAFSMPKIATEVVDLTAITP